MFNNHTDFKSCIIIYLPIRFSSGQTEITKTTYKWQIYHFISAHQKQLLSQYWLQTVHRNLHTSKQTTVLQTLQISFRFGQPVFFAIFIYGNSSKTWLNLHTSYINTYIKISILTKIAQVKYNIYTLQYFILPLKAPETHVFGYFDIFNRKSI